MPADKTCQPRARCHRWRHCEACANIRQARIADAVERLAGLAARLDWVTITPAREGEAALVAARNQFLKVSRPAGAVWTVEIGAESGKLHTNIIMPSQDAAPLRAAAIHVVKDITEPRRVAAYISKRSQHPGKQDFKGRLYGTAGPLWQYLTSGEAEPLATAAALQHEINSVAGTQPKTYSAPAAPAADPLTMADYRAIAKRHLPDILADYVRL
jgi:hypothetical protein